MSWLSLSQSSESGWSPNSWQRSLTWVVFWTTLALFEPFKVLEACCCCCCCWTAVVCCCCCFISWDPSISWMSSANWACKWTIKRSTFTKFGSTPLSASQRYKPSCSLLACLILNEPFSSVCMWWLLFINLNICCWGECCEKGATWNDDDKSSWPLAKLSNGCSEWRCLWRSGMGNERNGKMVVGIRLMLFSLSLSWRSCYNKPSRSCVSNIFGPINKTTRQACRQLMCIW